MAPFLFYRKLAERIHYQAKCRAPSHRTLFRTRDQYDLNLEVKQIQTLTEDQQVLYL